jgi:hypothetical protein
VILNDKSFEYNEHEDIIRDLICHIGVHFPYQPQQIIYENLSILFEVVIEVMSIEKELISDKKERLKTGRLIKKLENFMEFSKFKKTQASIITSAYDLILALEGLGLLNGFGVTNSFGDHIKGNPEKKSLKTFNTLRGNN